MNGSRNENIHSIVADGLICFCEKEKIVICPEWTHNEENDHELNDQMSSGHDSVDCNVRNKIF